jgi:hypothetical protein
MGDEPSDVVSGLGPAEFLIQPDLPPGVRIQIDSVIEAQQLTPEVIGILTNAMSEMQTRAAASSIPTGGCPRLQVCSGTYRGGCPRLHTCGTYAPPGTPTV